MSKIITFSRTYPSYMDKKWQPTYFVEKLLNKLVPGWQFDDVYWRLLAELNDKKLKSGKLTTWQLVDFWKNLDRSIKDEKAHTIRASHSKSVGQFLTPAVWSGRPYHDPQIIIAPDIEVKKIWDFETDECGVIAIGGKYYFDEFDEFGLVSYKILAANDGLDERDFLDWFKYPEPFNGQIIAWDENVNY